MRTLASLLDGHVPRLCDEPVPISIALASLAPHKAEALDSIRTFRLARWHKIVPALNAVVWDKSMKQQQSSVKSEKEVSLRPI